MQAEEIREIMRSVDVEEKFVKNWEEFHKKNFDEFCMTYEMIYLRRYLMILYRPSISFLWCNTPEGEDFWQSVYYSLIYRYVEEEVRLVKQAVLLLRKEGYCINEGSSPYYTDGRHSSNEDKVAFCVTVVSRKYVTRTAEIEVDEKTYIELAKSALIRYDICKRM